MVEEDRRRPGRHGVVDPRRDPDRREGARDRGPEPPPLRVPGDAPPRQNVAGPAAEPDVVSLRHSPEGRPPGEAREEPIREGNGHGRREPRRRGVDPDAGRRFGLDVPRQLVGRAAVELGGAFHRRHHKAEMSGSRAVCSIVLHDARPRRPALARARLRARLRRRVGELLQRGHPPLAAGDERDLPAEPLPGVRRAHQRRSQHPDRRLARPSRQGGLLRCADQPALPGGRAPQRAPRRRPRRALHRPRRPRHRALVGGHRSRGLLRLRRRAGRRELRRSRLHGDPRRGVPPRRGPGARHGDVPRAPRRRGRRPRRRHRLPHRPGRLRLVLRAPRWASGHGRR